MIKIVGAVFGTPVEIAIGSGKTTQQDQNVCQAIWHPEKKAEWLSWFNPDLDKCSLDCDFQACKLSCKFKETLIANKIMNETGHCRIGGKNDSVKTYIEKAQQTV